MNDVYSQLKVLEEDIYAKALDLKGDIDAYRTRLAASDHPAKETKRFQLREMLTRLAA